MHVTTQCPNPSCRRAIRVGERAAGVRLRCPHCGHLFVLPAPAATLSVAVSTAAGGPPSPAETLPDPVAAAVLPVRPSPPAEGPAETLDDPDRVRPIPSQAAALPGRVGRFAPRERLGEGAFGVVYRAHDPQLDREVALKVAKPGTLGTPQQVERFLREARSAAQLRHPNIVPLFEAGRDGDHHFLASAFITGQTLESAVAGRRLDLRRAAHIVRQLAEALAYAHTLGIIHRDVKPANVMLDERGEPLLMDFGLAARQEEAEKLTRDGAILGTPLYMAPEQAGGQRGEPRPASDQYSLGVVLYQLSCGQTPFAGPPEVVIFHHLSTDPPPPRWLNRKLPRDLETICLKCLEKDPARRYAGCRELADDLRRWLDDEPIQARRLHWGERMVRWCRREPRVAIAVAVTAVVLVGAAIEFALNAREQSHLRQQAEESFEKLTLETAARTKETEARIRAAEERERAMDHALLQARMAAYVTDVSRARRAWETSQVLEAEKLLEACPPDLRGWEWRHMLERCRRTAPTLTTPASTDSLAFHPDGKLLAGAGADKLIHLWDVRTRQVVRTLAGHTDHVHSVAFRPDGQRLASGSADRSIRLWDVKTGDPLMSLAGHAAEVKSVAFSPDGQRLASAGFDRTVRLWDLATGQEIFQIKDEAKVFWSVSFSPDSRLLAGASGNTARLWDARSGQEVRALTGHTNLVTFLVFSPDGKQLASCSDDRSVRIWDVSTGQVARTFSRPSNELVRSVAYHPGGRYLAAVGADATHAVFVWDLQTGQEAAALRGHSQLLLDVVYSPDGQRLASASADRTVRLWDLRPAQDTERIKEFDSLFTRSAFGPDGRQVATGQGKTASVWEADTGQEVIALKDDLGGVSRVAFSPSGDLLAGAGLNPAVRVWDVKTGRQIQSFRTDTNFTNGVAFSPDGRTLAAANDTQDTRTLKSTGGWVKVWEARTGKLVFGVSGVGVRDVAFSPDGRYLAGACADNGVRVWDIRTGKELFTGQGHTAGVNGVAFSPDGRRLASGSKDKTVRVWDSATGREAYVFKSHTATVRSVAFSPDSQRLASGADDLTVRLWDLRTGQEAFSFVVQSRSVIRTIDQVLFSPDGQYLVASPTDTSLRLWRATGRDERERKP